jgi:hypothetical protein
MVSAPGLIFASGAPLIPAISKVTVLVSPISIPASIPVKLNNPTYELAGILTEPPTLYCAAVASSSSPVLTTLTVTVLSAVEMVDTSIGISISALESK